MERTEEEERALMMAAPELAREYVIKNDHLTNFHSGEDFEHVVNMITSALQTKHNFGYPGGGFIQSVVNNDLYEALATADSTNQRNIILIVGGLYSIPLWSIEKRAKEITELLRS